MTSAVQPAATEFGGWQGCCYCCWSAAARGTARPCCAATSSASPRHSRSRRHRAQLRTTSRAFPERDQRLFEIAETREGMLDIYALRKCHIANLVAGRNNQLGKVAAPSQRWLYELQLWRRLSGCWNGDVPESLSDDSRERLAHLTETKTDQLPQVSWNALFASEEWVKNFSRASSPLSPDDFDEVEPRSTALGYLREATLHQFDRAWVPDSATLEGHLKTLQERPLSAELLRTLLLAKQRLAEASTLIEGVLEHEDGKACRGAPERLADSSEATRLMTWLNDLERAARHWLGAIDALLEVHVTPSTGSGRLSSTLAVAHRPRGSPAGLHGEPRSPRCTAQSPCSSLPMSHRDLTSAITLCY
ncbi:MAG: DUF3080 family protein [Halomonas sp.]|uniref:DUF3080 family protein n=1 Tax=Halomonas sp. TaxID=1486246 RepID=UPI002ACD2913|nr:DUF3080 family protein [Halomonas sp.]MDZ7853566.1 DUF3080 family protein [Halomonas sp.]